MRVLIVEDEPKMASLLHRGLGGEGMAVDVAPRGEDALWRAAATEYDAIVLPERPTELVAGDLRLDPASRRAWRADQEIALSATALPDRFAARLLPVVLLLLLAFWLHAIASKRRQRQALGFDPDFYLAVERRVDEHNRPELLFHQPSEQAEYSGWYVYASEQDTGSSDLVAWSLKDLIDHYPEAVCPLREGDGTWSWDQARRTYSRAPATSGG